MTVPEILEERAAFSFEVFPPKTDVGMEKLCSEGGVLDHLYELKPDYISCTYGAGGTNVGKNLEVLDKIKKDGKCIPVTHFTCIGNTKEGIKEQLENYLDARHRPHAGAARRPALRLDRARAAICTMPPSWYPLFARSSAISSPSRLRALRKATSPAAAWMRTYPS